MWNDHEHVLIYQGFASCGLLIEYSATYVLLNKDILEHTRAFFYVLLLVF